jgi:hypothetical protein
MMDDIFDGLFRGIRPSHLRDGGREDRRRMDAAVSKARAEIAKRTAVEYNKGISDVLAKFGDKLTPAERQEVMEMRRVVP